MTRVWHTSEQLIAAEAVLFIVQADGPRLAAAVDGKIVGAGGELDVALGAVVLGVDQPVFVDPADLFAG